MKLEASKPRNLVKLRAKKLVVFTLNVYIL